jgi:hypothetical protein
MSTTNRRLQQLRAPDDFRKVFALTTETAIALVTVVVVSRRLSGSFRGPVAPAVPCLVATLTALLSLAALALWRQAAPARFRQAWIPLAALALAVLAPVALGAALWLTPSAFVGGYLAALALVSLVGAVAIEDSAGGFVLTDELRSALFARVPAEPDRFVNTTRDPERLVAAPLLEAPPATASVPAADIEPAIDPDIELGHESAECLVDDSFADEESESLIDDEEHEADESIVQWMTRRRLADGGEVIEGAVRIELDPAEKVGVAHLAFSPPLACDPRAECHLLSDFDGRVRITAAKSYGLRIEARQSGQLSLAATINVAFSAQAPPAATHAAAA